MNEKIEHFMKNNLTIDSLSHGPLIWSKDLISKNNELIEKGINPWNIIPQLVLMFAKKVVNDKDYFEDYKIAWNESMVDCVSWTLGPLYSKPYSFEGVFHNFSFMTYMVDNRPEFFVKVLKADDILKASKENKKAIILNFQSMEHIGNNLDYIELYYMQGFRIMQLTYNTKNLVGTGCTAKRDRGLTDFGKQVIKKMNELGILIDISHCGIQTTTDTIQYSKKPVVATHTFSKGLYLHDRGKPDEILKALRDKGGYVGILAVPGFLVDKSETTINDWLDHIDYVINLIGIDYVGIGTDFYGFSVPDNLAEKIGEFMDLLGFRPEHKASFLTKIKNFENYSKFPNLIKGLFSRGYTENEVKSQRYRILI
ncbi:MAG: membrane dipeptidase [Candidatus Lokiarchaeota archaeon]